MSGYSKLACAGVLAGALVSGVVASETPPSLTEPLCPGTGSGSQPCDAPLLAIREDTFDRMVSGELERVAIHVLGDEVVFERVAATRRHQTSTWYGVEHPLKASIIVTLGRGHLRAEIVRNGTRVVLEPTRTPFVVQSRMIDPNVKADGIACEVEPASPPKTLPPPECGPYTPDSGSIIDVMILVTQGLADRNPGPLLQTLIQSLIDFANVAYISSGIQTQLRLVHVEVVDYPDDSPGDMAEALQDLIANAGVFSNVEELRTEYGADQVTLLRDYVDEGCGKARLIRDPNAAGAYAVVQEGEKGQYVCGRLVLAHEIGHNLGCMHDRSNSSFPGRFEDSYGFQQQDHFFTLMAYPNGCGSCVSIPNFSNPNVEYEGVPTGIALPDPESANCARTINIARRDMACYRRTRIPFPPRHATGRAWLLP